MVGYIITGLDAGFRKGVWFRIILRKKNMKFLNFHQNSNENEIVLVKRGFFAEFPLDPPLYNFGYIR